MMPNEELNNIWKDVPCSLCGRKFPKTILNIEGTIHHREKIRCIDTKACNRARKKNAKKK